MKIVSPHAWFIPVACFITIVEVESTRGADALVPAGATWRYLDTGSDPGSAWYQPDFDHSGWTVGEAELGFGDGAEATVINSGIITAYFRHAFAVTDASGLSNVRLRVRRDDGVIVYLNGVEIFRDNMPAGPASYFTLAAGNAGNEDAYLEAAVAASALADGPNVIAAEVHQAEITSSDLSFDLELLADGVPPPPLLPVVELEVELSQATEPGPDDDPAAGTGLVRITRTGATDEDLSVSLQFSGGAENGLDIVFLQETVTIPSGSADVNLLIEPLADTLDEGMETFVISLVEPACAQEPAPEPGCYRVGPSRDAAVTIHDPEDPPPPPPPATLIPFRSVWKYLDDGSDQGAAWRAPEFDDGDWASGSGQLGYGDGDEATVIAFGPDPADKHITYYFRHAFDVEDASAFTTLPLQVLRDDGVAVYLNGIEVFRNNLPPVEIDYQTLAEVAPDENAYFAALISPAALVEGRNVIAAEVHQSSPLSSDLGFDLALAAGQDDDPPGAFPAVSVHAVDREAAEQDPNSDQLPNPGLFFVSRSGPTDEPLAITVRYAGTAENGVDCGPLPTTIEIPAGQESIELPVEIIDDGDVEGTETLVMILVQPACASEWPPVRDCYRVGTYSAGTITILDNDEAPPPETVTLVPAGSVWKFLDDGSDQGTAWRAADFDDSAWASGPAQLGYGDGDEATVIGFGPSPESKHITYYFRHAFDASDIARFQELHWRVLRDDGVAVYLNGMEIIRDNLPAGPLEFTTTALVPGVDENAYHQFVRASSALLEGRNVLAAEVHQVDAASSDVGFDLELAGVAGPPPLTIQLVPGGAGGGLQFKAAGAGSSSYLIESSTDLKMWVPVQTIDAAEAGEPVSCPRPVNQPMGFFRLREINP